MAAVTAVFSLSWRSLSFEGGDVVALSMFLDGFGWTDGVGRFVFSFNIHSFSELLSLGLWFFGFWKSVFGECFCCFALQVKSFPLV